MKQKTDQNHTLLHGSAILLRDGVHPPSAVFLRGLSGSGKSDLAFRLIENTGGALISDDQVAFEKRGDKIYAEPVEAIKGLLEVRGVGLLRYPVDDAAVRLRLVVNLVKYEEVPRLPEWKTVDILGVPVPHLELYAFEMSATRKIMKAMEVVHHPEKVIR